MQPDPYAAVAQQIASTCLPAMRTAAEEAAARVRLYAEALRQFGHPDTVEAAQQFEGWLKDGDDLMARLRLKVAPGGRFDLPAVAEPLQRRDDAIRELAAYLHKPGLSERAQLRRLCDALRDPGVAGVVRDVSGAVSVPTSISRLRTILRFA